MIKNVTILTGFLGAGKTTLLNALIKTNKDIRYAIIENEIGKESIDAELVLSSPDQLIELNDGCLCCSLNDDLIDALDALLKKRNTWDELIIEATGVADPASIAYPFLTEPDIQQYFTLKRVICVIDAAQVEDQLKETEEAVSQISFSDILLINKTGEVSDIYLKQLVAMLKTINPFAEVVSEIETDMKVEELQMMERSSEFRSNPRPVLTPKGILNLIPISGKNISIPASAGIGTSHKKHQHSNIETILLRFHPPMDLEKLAHQLRVFLIFQAAGVYRIKGIINDKNFPHKVILQSAGQRLAVTEGNGWDTGEVRESKIVIIGKNLQLKGIEKIFSDCLIT